MRSAIGLRLPASVSCLGRHSRLTGRCPNNSSLFPPLAAVVVVAAEKLFVICKSGKSADFPDLLFHGRGRGGKRHICDMQFADVACALKTQSAINFQRPPWHFLQLRYWYFDYIYEVICCKYYSPKSMIDKYK